MLSLTPRQIVETQVHNYFLDFYGEENVCKKDCEKGVSYLYNGGEVAVDHIICRDITESDAEVLSRLGL